MRSSTRLDPAIASQTPAAVFSLIAGCLSDDPHAAIRQIRRQGLWEYVAAEACDAQVGAILLERLTQLDIDVPESAAGQMQAYRDHVAAANAYKFDKVGRVLTRLQMAKVPFLLLKGAALNATIYAPGLRPMTDVDVLVHPADVNAADRVLRNAGCRLGADLVRADFYPRYYYEREYFTRGEPAVKIDLHCRPFRLLRYARTVPDNAMWNGMREVCLADRPVQIPGPEEMLIQLAVHAACHGNTHLRWLYDMRLWIERFGHEIDVASLAAKCRRWRLTLPVHRALQKTREMLGRTAGESPRAASASPRTAGESARAAGFSPRGPSIHVRPRIPTNAQEDPLDAAIRATATVAGPLDRLALATAHLGQDAPVLYTATSALTTPGLRFRIGYLSAVLLPEPTHLAQLYPRRHPGWQLAAHATRAIRCLKRAWAISGDTASA